MNIFSNIKIIMFFLLTLYSSKNPENKCITVFTPKKKKKKIATVFTAI